jgi:hypothetical protein
MTRVLGHAWPCSKPDRQCHQHCRYLACIENNKVSAAFFRHVGFFTCRGDSSCSDTLQFLAVVRGTLFCNQRCLAGGTCRSQHDRCPQGTRLWSLSEVNLDLPPGSVGECFKVAIGTKPGLDSVAKVGLDVLLDFVCAPPQCTRVHSSCAWTPSSA